METKTITQGRDGCKVSGAYKLIFPIRKDYYHVRNDGTETAYASVFSDSTDTAEDGVYDIPSGGTLCIRSHGSDTLYVSGDVTVMGTASAVFPFKFAPVSGGGGGGLTQLYSGAVGASQSKVTTFNADLSTYTALIICPIAAANGNVEYSPSTIIPVSKLSDVFLNFSLFNYVNSTVRDSHGQIKCDNNVVSVWFYSNVFTEATIYGIN